jgi:hypothetical protein
MTILKSPNTPRAGATAYGDAGVCAYCDPAGAYCLWRAGRRAVHEAVRVCALVQLAQHATGRDAGRVVGRTGARCTAEQTAAAVEPVGNPAAEVLAPRVVLPPAAGCIQGWPRCQTSCCHGYEGAPATTTARRSAQQITSNTAVEGRTGRSGMVAGAGIAPGAAAWRGHAGQLSPRVPREIMSIATPVAQPRQGRHPEKGLHHMRVSCRLEFPQNHEHSHTCGTAAPGSPPWKGSNTVHV